MSDRPAEAGSDRPIAVRDLVLELDVARTLEHRFGLGGEAVAQLVARGLERLAAHVAHGSLRPRPSVREQWLEVEELGTGPACAPAAEKVDPPDCLAEAS